MADEPQTAPAAHQVVEVDTRDQTDSAYGDETESYTESLTSSIKNHAYENGRRYHSFRAGKYYAPNDDEENNRLDMHHHLATLLLGGKLHIAPIGDKPQRILDVGCGTGIWSIDMGDEYPSAEIVGVDLSPTQPQFVPPNVQFEIDDVEEVWTFQQPFDLIHVRFMAASIRDWPKLVNQTYQHTKPGGWCEFKDWDLNIVSDDDSLPEDSYVLKYHKLLYEAFEKIGLSCRPGPKLKDWVESAGFEGVQETVLPVPIGLWPRERKFIGFWNLVCLEEGLEAIAIRVFTGVLNWQPEEVQVLLAHVRNELKAKKIHAQYTYYVVYGRKPR